MEMRQIGWMFVLVALLACPGWADIINGSFETGDFTGWFVDAHGGYAEVVSGGTDGDWVASLKLEGSYVEIYGEMVFSPSHVFVSQRFIVPDDAQYLLFDSWVGGLGTLHVAIGDPNQPALIVSSCTPATYALPIWSKRGEEIQFAVLGRDTDQGDNNYAYLDNVRIVDVPEPSALLMLGAGLCSLRVLTRLRP